MTRKTLTPTAEQQAAIDLAMTGKSMAVEALAGTGKTSTLGLIAEALGREGKRGLFLSFSKAIVTEAAERMPANVSCSTAHSLAFRAVGKNYAARLKAPRMRVWDIARFLGCTPFVVELDGNAGKRRLSDGAIATMAGRAIRNFTLSADDAPGPQHVPGLDVATYESNRAFKAHVAAYLDRYWADITDNHGRLPFTHDCYLKIWQLSGPRLNSDFVLYDEAQDCNPVMLAIVEENRDRCQLIFVGDRHQQIYSWRGAANAMAEAPVDGRTYLTQSFRFGAGVATVANVVLERLGAEQLVQGNPALVSTYGPMDGDADAVLCRTNAELITQVMSEVEAGRRPGVVGGVDEIVAFAKAATDLMNGRSTTHPNLTGFDSWSDVLAYVESPACDDDDLARLVKLLNTHDPVKIINVLSRCADVRDADVVFSTAHKAKGLEWNRVRLAGDFDYDLNDAAPETLRLLYVAITRAKGHIDLGPMHAQLVEEA